MQVNHLISLPAKFQNSIINNKPSHLHDQLNKIFSQLSNPLTNFLSEENGFSSLEKKAHVVTHSHLPGQIIKGKRQDGFMTCKDVHIYRVRKALRIQKVIENRQLSDVIVPRKQLYHHKGEWLVIAEKLNIKHEPFNASLLTPKQAEEITYLCFEGKLGDVHEQNLHTTVEGKIAILDTEPISRPIKKALKNWFTFVPHYKSSIEFMLSMVNSECLFTMSSLKTEAQEKIRSVQNKMFLSHIGKIALKIAVPLIVSIGLLVGATLLANPLLIAGAAVGVALAGAHAINGIGFMLYSTYQYNHIRSIAGHFMLMGGIN